MRKNKEKTKSISKPVVQLEDVTVLRPTDFSDIQTAIDLLMASRPVGISFDQITSELTQRFIDFLSGASYALEGNVKQLTEKEFLFVPYGVEVVVPW